jgi:UDP-N-acetylglucosamine 2-epimerase (non-hydrolysing)
MARRLRVLSVVGTRPNFMKTVPVVAALRRRPDEFEETLVHTGQHYDDAMSNVFFTELGVGRPDFMLDVGSGSHGAQTARVMERLEPVLLEWEPDVVLVPGDVNSTLAAAVTAAKLQIPVAHIEAGLRSFDRTMPEELNRIVTDQLCDLLFVHSPEARDNLVAEGRPDGLIHDVGNTMIDTLVALRPRIEATAAASATGLTPGGYLLVTLHRPALVDGPRLDEVVEELVRVAEELPVVFPIHPRTRARMEARGLEAPGVRLVDPLGYLDFMSLVTDAAGVLTDSGGIQEETTYLGVPCFTLRDNTERPVTCSLGTNLLLGLAPERIGEVPGRIRAASRDEAAVPPGWDGRAAERVVDVLAAYDPEGAAGAAPSRSLRT